MTQEDKEIILKDICSRLPYGVKVSVDNTTWCDFDGSTPKQITIDNSYKQEEQKVKVNSLDALFKTLQ